MTVARRYQGDLKQALIQQAIQIVKQEGTAKLTLRRLGKDLGVSAMAAYRHFENKEALLQHVAILGFDELNSYLDIENSDLLQLLIEQGVAYVQFAIEHPAHYQLMFSDFELGQWGPELAQASNSSFAQMAKTIAAIVDKGDCAINVTTAEAALICWSNVHGIAQLSLSGKLPAQIKIRDFSHESCRVLVAGLFLASR